MKHYFLGLAANYSREQRLRHTFAIGRKKDCVMLEDFLREKYGGEAILTKNGRSALALAFKAYFGPGDAVLVNGFTCYAVYEAVKAAKLTPIFVDINKKDLNFTVDTLEKALKTVPVKTHVSGIIIQNSLGNPVNIVAIEKFAKKHNLAIIEDLAHCTGVKYPDGREVGTVGVATALSFGKDKSIDTISGGAVIYRGGTFDKSSPYKSPRPSDHLRARFYPMFGALCRTLSYLHLGGILMRFLVKIHWVEKSADNKLELGRRISKFQAKMALEQLKTLKKSGEPPLKEFYLVSNRAEVLDKLKKSGYYFDGFWYEKPVSPARYYKKVNFPEKDCPNAVFISGHIVNLPTCYNKRELERARKIIKEHLSE